MCISESARLVFLAALIALAWSCGKSDDPGGTGTNDTGSGDTATDLDSDSDTDSDSDSDSDTDSDVDTDSDTDSDGDTDTDTSLPDNGFVKGPITPPVADGEGTAYVEGDCTHTYVADSCGSGWCRIPNGCFIYGSPVDEWGHGVDTEVETPLTLSHDFVIQKHEATRAEWEILGFQIPQMEPSSSGVTSCTEVNCPVVGINWWEVVAAANRLSVLHELETCYELTGCTGQVGEEMICKTALAVHPNVYDCQGYRVPTLAEWEYSAKAGTRTSFYSGSITVNDSTGGYSHDEKLDPIGWYWFNSGGGTDIYQKPFNEGKTTHPVEKKQPNEWGLRDMLGNVREWTWDRFSGGGFGGIPQTDPLDNGATERHAMKGGGAASPSKGCRSSSHFEATIDSGANSVGLRLVRTVSWPKGKKQFPVDSKTKK